MFGDARIWWSDYYDYVQKLKESENHIDMMSWYVADYTIAPVFLLVGRWERLSKWEFALNVLMVLPWGRWAKGAIALKISGWTEKVILKAISNESRLQHAYVHVVDVLWKWNNPNKKRFIEMITNIVKNPDWIVNTLERRGGEEIVRFSKYIWEYEYFLDIFVTWKDAELIRTITRHLIK